MPACWTGVSGCEKSALCNGLNITFTPAGRDPSTLTQWYKGRPWGLWLYKEGYDDGLWFTICLRTIETPKPVGPNPVLKPSHPAPMPGPRFGAPFSAHNRQPPFGNSSSGDLFSHLTILNPIPSNIPRYSVSPQSSINSLNRGGLFCPERYS